MVRSQRCAFSPWIGEESSVDCKDLKRDGEGGGGEPADRQASPLLQGFSMDYARQLEPRAACRGQGGVHCRGGQPALCRDLAQAIRVQSEVSLRKNLLRAR